MAIGTAGPSTVQNGSSNLASLFFAFVDVASPVVSDAQHARATGSGAVINFTGTNLNASQGVVTSFSLTFDGDLNVTYTDVDLSFDRLKLAITTAASTDNQSIFDAFRGVDWTYDLTAIDVFNPNVSGSGGNDVFKLGSGNDFYSLDGGKDKILLGGGDDIIRASNDYGYTAKGLAMIDGQHGSDTFILANGIFDYFDKAHDIDLNGTAKLNGGTVQFKNVENVDGSSHGEKISGTAVANILDGFEGDDILYGRGGSDTLTGGVNDDVFLYASVKDSKAGGSHDVITDFGIGVDTLDFAGLHPDTRNDKLTFIGDSDFHKKAGELRFEIFDLAGDADDYTMVEIDMNGDKKADMQIELSGIVDLTKQDFSL